jgi:hypothetical protein
MAIEFPPPTGDSHLKQPLSIAVVETIFMAFMLVLGFQAAFTVVAQQLGISFQTYLLISPVMMITGLGITIWLQWHVFKQIGIIDKRILGGLLLMGILLAMLPLITNRPTTDDYFYIPNAVYALEHPTQPMDFEIHFLIGAATDKPIISQSQSTSLAYDYFRAVIAHYSKIDFLTVYFRFGMLTGFLLPLAYFLLISRFTSDTRRAFDGTLIAICLLLLSIEGPRTFAIAFFWDAHLGKLILFSIGFPVFAAFSISFFKNPSIKSWIALFACVAASVGMTSSAAILLPGFAFVLLAAFILTAKLGAGLSLDWKTLLFHGVSYLSCLGYAFIYALFLYFQLEQGNTTGNPFDLSGQSDFLSNLFYFSSPYFPFTLTSIVLSVAAVCIFVRGWQRKFLVAWMAILFLTFLNPFATPILIGAIIPRNIYWRLFYLMPFPLMASVSAVSAPIYKTIQKVQYVILPIAVATYLLVIYQQGYLSFSLDQLPVQNLNIAREISKVAPQGLMLAPSNLSGPITMVSADHPQMITLPTALIYWLVPLGQKKDAISRTVVDGFIMGNNQYLQQMTNLVNAYPKIRSIVLSRNAMEKNTILLKFLKDEGFTKSLSIDEYILVWK